MLKWLALLLLALALTACGQRAGGTPLELESGPHPEPPLDLGDVATGPGAGAPAGGSSAEPMAGAAGEPSGMPADPSPSDPSTAGEAGEAPQPPPGAMPDAGVAADAAVQGTRAVDPCDNDLEADTGSVTPDIPDPGVGQTIEGDLAREGRFAVLRLDASIADPDPARAALPATFYAPSEDGGATAVAGPLPLVLVMHGFATNHVLYEHFSDHLASHGLLVLGVTLPLSLVAEHPHNAAQALAAIDFALGSAAAAAVAGRADAERIAVAGHSFGGKIAFYAAALDARIDVVIGWDPSNAGGPPCFIDPAACNAFPVAPNCMAMDAGMLDALRAESLVFRAAPDGANPEADHNALHFYRGAPGPATLVDYDTNAAHGDWANAGAEVIDHTRRVQLALLLARFTGAQGIEPLLPGGADLAAGAGVVRVLHKGP